jgi:hypothetical protein
LRHKRSCNNCSSPDGPTIIGCCRRKMPGTGHLGWRCNRFRRTVHPRIRFRVMTLQQSTIIIRQSSIIRAGDESMRPSILKRGGTRAKAGVDLHRPRVEWRGRKETSSCPAESGTFEVGLRFKESLSLACRRACPGGGHNWQARAHRTTRNSRADRDPSGGIRTRPIGPRSRTVYCGRQHIRPKIQPDCSTAVSYPNRLADPLCSRPGQARRKADDVRVMHPILTRRRKRIIVGHLTICFLRDKPNLASVGLRETAPLASLVPREEIQTPCESQPGCNRTVGARYSPAASRIYPLANRSAKLTTDR